MEYRGEALATLSARGVCVPMPGVLARARCAWSSFPPPLCPIENFGVAGSTFSAPGPKVLPALGLYAPGPSLAELMSEAILPV